MNPTQQKAVAKEFVKRWQAAEGNEDREARSFWIELYQDVLGIQRPTQVLDFERRIAGRKCDVFHEDQRVLVEMKSRGVSLDESSIRSKKAGEETPYEQALWYFNHLGVLSKPYYLITCNFDELRIYDMREEIPDEGTYVFLKLEELPEKAHLLGFITDTSTSRLQVEQELSVKAAELVGKLYDGFAKQYANLETSAEEQHSLNVLIVRLVFLLYAEDAGLLQEHQAFLHYLQRFEVKDMRRALIDLFEVLNTPDAERDPYMDEDLAAFPYVNGGLFEDKVIIPQFTLDLRVCLLAQASAGFDWKGISPTIFGAAFESTLNPETRRAGGCHFTSIDNIHKVIDPLFLDDLKAELAKIEGEKVEKTRKMRLRLFQRKLASINILDPACGSGNFLTESYICLRHLENRVLADLLDESQIGMDLGGDESQIMVNINQLYGIEINDFAVSVAKTALWIAESQAMEETQDILFKPFEFLPLKSVNNLHCGNALRMDWNDVLPAQQCSYIVGNPPFLGSSTRSSSQTDDMGAIAFANERKWGKVDYCGAWYHMARLYMDANHTIGAAFVSTNSICQGEQVEPMWKPLMENDMVIDFAYKPFIWDSEASEQAHVHVVIIGFSYGVRAVRKLIRADGSVTVADNINGYLTAAPSVFIPARGRAVDKAHCQVIQGSKPVDGGGLVIKADDYEQFVEENTDVAPYVRPYVGADEFIKGKDRYCLWLKDAPESILENDAVKERLRTVTAQRLGSPTREFRECADRPHLFVQDRQPAGRFLIIPQVSSERREYVPIGYLDEHTIVSNLAYVVPGATLFDFGLVTSKMHNAWMRAIAGRLESRYRYSPTVYNTFAYPDADAEQRDLIEKCSQAVLDAREAHPGKSLAELYDPDKMPADLLAAHKALDAAVEAAYGVDFDGDEEKIVAHLFKLYAELTTEE